MAYLGNSPLNRFFSTQAVTLGQGQTAVNIGYTPGLTLFFKNGALLEAPDYTATNGSVVTLTSPANASDVLTVISLAQFAVANALALTGGTLTGPVTGPASASESAAGLIKLATTAIAQGLTDDETALTPAKLSAVLEASSLTALRGLRGACNSASPTTKFDLSAATIQFSGTPLKDTVSATVDLALAGPSPNGRDQALAFPNSSEVNVFFIYNPMTEETATVASLADTPTLPSGFTGFVYATTLMLSASGEIRPVRVSGARVEWDGAAGTSVTVNSVNTSYLPLSLATVMPVRAIRAILNFGLSVNNSALFTFVGEVRPGGSANSGKTFAQGSVIVENTALNVANTREIIPSTSRTIETRINGTPSSGGYWVDSVGYVVPNGDC